jgi:hypothetical protein
LGLYFPPLFEKKEKTMSATTIGAETARWAGLQIDLHSKFRSGNLTPDQLEWWLNQPKDKREALIVGDKSNSEPTEKFTLLVDLGIITVPNGYSHANHLDKFVMKNRKKFYSINDNITDVNFANPTRVLKPGQKYRVRAFQQVVSGTTTSEERMSFLLTQKAIHTGAQGESLVFEQKRDQLPKGKWYYSLDEIDRLWAASDGTHGVSRVSCHSDGVFLFDIGYFESFCDGGCAFLCFTEV